MFKNKIPKTTITLCLTLSSTITCKKELSPEDAADAYCMKIPSCFPEDEQNEEQCKLGVEYEIESYAIEYGEDCEKAYINYFLCLGNLSCAELNGEEDVCIQEANLADEACS